MDGANSAARNTHLENLYRMVAYCENKTDCRRGYLLDYFGEIFNRETCLQNKSTACDNCLCQVNIEKYNLEMALIFTRDLISASNVHSRCIVIISCQFSPQFIEFFKYL